MVRAGVIGVGNMGKNHVRVLKMLDGVDLVGIADISEAGKEIAEKFECKYYRDYKEMLEGEDLDMVSITVPTNLHNQVALECIQQGVNVFVEKPLADTTEKAREIIRAAKDAGVLLSVGHIERFNPAVRKLKEIIVEGKLGDITSIIARRVGIFPPQIKDANVFLDLAVHDIDIFNYLLEKDPVEVSAKAGSALDSEREDHALIMVDYGTAACLVQVNWITPVKVRNLAVTGTKGYVELNYITQELKVFESIYERTYDSFGDFVIKFGTPKEEEVEITKEEPLKAELGHFVGCVRDGGQPAVTGEDGLKAVELAIKSHESYMAGKPIGYGK